MLFKRPFLEGIAAGTITLAFRRWKRPTVRAGGQLRTPVGILAINAIDTVTLADITDVDARQSGFPDKTELLTELGKQGNAQLYRIQLHFAGADPREELCQNNTLTDDEFAELIRRLQRLDTTSRHGTWTMSVLKLIRNYPGTRATDLAAMVNRDVQLFKTDVRKLKALGLTESLQPGYQLSPRGRVVLDRWLLSGF